jgi:hypothetical protein
MEELAFVSVTLDCFHSLVLLYLAYLCGPCQIISIWSAKNCTVARYATDLTIYYYGMYHTNLCFLDISYDDE